MPVATIAELKEELSFATDLGTVDDAMLTRHLVTAEAVIERNLGFTFATQYLNATPALPVPPALKQAVLWLAVDYYEGRGRPDGAESLPPHVADLVWLYREWSF
jgi:Phage gp6-like head-tail connector protein